MNWQVVTIVGLLLCAGVALVALGQATIAGGAITSAIGIAALLTNARKPQPQSPPLANPDEDAPAPGDVN